MYIKHQRARIRTSLLVLHSYFGVAIRQFTGPFGMCQVFPLSILSLLLGAVCGCAWVQAPKRETLVSIWLGQSQQMAMALYHNKAPLETFGSPVWANLLVLTTFAAQTIQFVIYLTIFKHLSDHDQSMAWLFPEGQFQKRKRNNAIDLARCGHYQVLKSVAKFQQMT